MNRKRAILTSCSIILLCTAIITGVTYSLFSEEVNMKNHLQAGELQIKLYRTELKYMDIDAEGYLEEKTDATVQDYSPGSAANETNVFGLDKNAVKMVPGSWRQAKMELVSPAANDVAFDYEVKIQLSSESNALAEQLYVTVGVPGEGGAIVNVVENKPLSECVSNDKGYTVITDMMEATGVDSTHTFIVKLEFVDSEDNNNVNSTMNVSFDLFVIATQRTDTPTVEETTAAATESGTEANG